MSSTVLVISDRAVFEEAWRRALGDVGLNSRATSPGSVASEIRADSIVLVDADSTLLDEDELLAVLGFARAVPLSVLSRAFPVMWAGFWVNALSGVLLFAADPSKATVLFMWKLAIIAAGVALIIALKRRLYGRGTAMDAAGFGVKAIAVVSLALWIAAIATGRWMAYAV